jgi:hypothetical protein
MVRVALRVFPLAIFVFAGCGGTDNTAPEIVHASNIRLVSGNGQTANVSHTLLTPLTVEAVNTDGSPAVNVAIEWTVSSGEGHFSEASTRTNNDGKSSGWWTLGKWGQQSATATASSIAGSPSVQFNASATAPVAIRFDGEAWRIALEDSSGADMDLEAVWVGSSSRVIAAGQCNTNAFALSYDGNAWKPAPGICIPPRGTPSFYTNVSGNPDGDIFYVFQGLGLSFWEVWIIRVTGLNSSAIYYDEHRCCYGLRATFSRSTNDVVAVGDSGEVQHYDGTAWNREASGTKANLHAVWGTDASVFAVGDDGTIVYFDGNSWHQQPSQTTQSLYAVWGTTASDVFAVGAGGTILHYDGAAWTPQVSGSTRTLRGVWGSAANAVLAVGDSSTILQYSGSTWVVQSANTSIDLRAVWGSSASNVYAVGRWN